jgi:hypothetical protein
VIHLYKIESMWNLWNSWEHDYLNPHENQQENPYENPHENPHENPFEDFSSMPPMIIVYLPPPSFAPPSFAPPSFAPPSFAPPSFAPLPRIQRLQRQLPHPPPRRRQTQGQTRIRHSTVRISNLPSQTLRTADIQRLPDRTCGICLETFKSGNVILRLPCLHIYHRRCITPWLNTNPICPQDQVSAFDV